ncbi:MAG: bifunctional protein-serine/threonine kinase/phosphatase, partial [Verrucomicrobia bacterium]|nr:bifunctional protein-serine/threonine kinase/phosphatase [Verrucomicrobiota bacterium]
MEATCAQLSITGPVRPHNEDFVGLSEPETPEQRRSHGILAVIADGVGGESRGEVASQLAVTSALSVFREARPETPPPKLLRQIFTEANRQVHDASLENPEGGSMSTTLTVAILRNDEIVIGNVGDSRVYLVRKDTVKRLTTDHCYVALQVKLGLLHERDAMTSPMRSMLTRSLGRELFCRYDTNRHTLFSGDIIVQCTDGLYANLTDEEIADTVRHFPPAEACQRLVALLERRPVDDNISVQVIRVNQVERVVTYRGATYYHEGFDAPVNSELQPGQVLDRRFEITELVNRSGMACIYKATDRENGETVALKVPHMQFESDVATFSRFEREEEIGRRLEHPYILKILPVEGVKSRPYIVMEYLEGQTLAQLMQNVRPLPEPDAVRIASRVCEALDHMHQRNVVHRDLKPQNIMLCNDGSIRIMDFGIAKAAQMRRITFVGFSPTMGTPDYMAPEQVR